MGLMTLIKGEDNFTEEREELVMSEKAVEEVNGQIKTVVNHTFSSL
jgi:hypothetical protein